MAKSLTQLSWTVIVGSLPLSFIPELPSESQPGLLALSALLLLLFPWHHTKFLALSVMMFIWSATAAEQLIRQIETLTSKPIATEVQIVSVRQGGERLTIRLLRAEGNILFPPVYATLNQPQLEGTLCAGQRWQMSLRLRPVHARLNEGEFDLQRFALASGTLLTGRASRATQLSSHCGWRQTIIDHAQPFYQHLTWQSIITALAFGERSEMPSAIALLLRETGTLHLMAISGMHIGLAAIVGRVLARGLQFFFSAARIGQRFPILVSLLVALCYTWLSGSNPPAIRAMLALTLWSIIRLSGMNCSNWQVWSFCIGLIIFCDPMAIISDSFWLSALAVAALLLWYQWFPLPKRFMHKKRWLFVQLLHLQIGMMVLLMPFQAWLFHGISLTALVANIIAVPVVSFITVPLILIALMVPLSLSSFLWWLVDRSLALVLTCLQLLPAGWLSLSQHGVIFCLFGWIIVAAIRFGWWRTSPVTIASLLFTLLYWRQNLPKPDWRLDMLDVGHGLAIVISRHNKAVIYDTGNRWPDADAGARVIIPWLRWQGIEPQQVILSHGHLDHTGGLESLLQAYPALSVRSALLKANHLPCYEGERWRWEELNFRVLWPAPANNRGGNNDSCVVLIDDGKHRVLLTGDLESPAELQLIAKYKSLLQADILQVPHHGSRTSSSPPLLRTVKGSLALASVARFSAWRLPAKQIIQRYGEYGYQWRDTAVSGQLSVQFFNGNWQVKGLREQILPRWYHQWFGVPRESR